MSLISCVLYYILNVLSFEERRLVWLITCNETGAVRAEQGRWGLFLFFLKLFCPNSGEVWPVWQWGEGSPNKRSALCYSNVGKCNKQATKKAHSSWHWIRLTMWAHLKGLRSVCAKERLEHAGKAYCTSNAGAAWGWLKITSHIWCDSWVWWGFFFRETHRFDGGCVLSSDYFWSFLPN